jgi:Cu(I)/Ag(I) efflux system membrane protein CusA/SilA
VRWYSSWAPDWLKTPLRSVWPEQQPMSWDELTTEMNARMQFPGWTNAWTMPIKTRVDMLTTGVRTPIGIKVFGTDLDAIETIGTSLEHVLAPIHGTRSVLYERNLGGLYIDIVPRADRMARYGLRVADVEAVIEGAIGGTPIGTTIEGRNRFTINVRYPRDMRDDVDGLRRLLIPVGSRAGGAGGAMDAGGPMGTQGALWPPRGSHGVTLAQAMDGMGPAGGGPPPTGPGRLTLPSGRTSMSDAPGGMAPGGPAMAEPPAGPAAGPMPGPAIAAPPTPSGAATQAFVPLGEIADVRITGGPPMVRDEAGMLVGYVYVDIDPRQRDIGGYVNDAKQVVAKAMSDGTLSLPPGYHLKWTGQYEQLEEMGRRMKLVIPLALLIVIILLYLQFRSAAEVAIVLLSFPFALVGSVWLLWLLDYRLSTAVSVGLIALIGLAAQTGIVMIVYINQAFARRKAEGRINDLADIIAAHMEGTVQRVRPKLMTVATMLIGLTPLLWASSSGADVMKRIAAPMVGGLLTSAFLTLEVIPVVITYYRHEQLLWQRLASTAPALLPPLRSGAAVTGIGVLLWMLAAALPVYVEMARFPRVAMWVAGLIVFLIGVTHYLGKRPRARQAIWPTTTSGSAPTA